MSASVFSRVPVGAAPIAEPVRAELGPSRIAAISGAVILFFFALTVASVAVRPGAPVAEVLPGIIPIVVGASAVGVGRLSEWAPQLWENWRGWFGYATAAPWLLLLAASAIVPQLALPAWVAVATASLLTLPMLWLAAAPGKRASRPAVRDAYGRQGGLWASAALGLAAYSVGDAPLDIALQLVIPVLLAVAALRPRGLADAGATWTWRQWLALAWGAGVVSATVVGAQLGMLPTGWTPAVAGLAAGIPLLAASGIRAQR